MKCHILFSGKNKKSTISLWSAEFVQSVVKVKVLCIGRLWCKNQLSSNPFTLSGLFYRNSLDQCISNTRVSD